jgi:hypothetical protein
LLSGYFSNFFGRTRTASLHHHQHLFEHKDAATAEPALSHDKAGSSRFTISAPPLVDVKSYTAHRHRTADRTADGGHILMARSPTRRLSPPPLRRR